MTVALGIEVISEIDEALTPRKICTLETLLN